MKNSKSVFFTLFFLFSFLNILLAQFDNETISLFGGISLPQEGLVEISGEKVGDFQSGFCGMVDFSQDMGNNIRFVYSLSISQNSFVKSAVEKNLSELQISVGDYFTSWTMAGLSYEFPVSPMIKIYGLGQIGLLLASLPDITLTDDHEIITPTTDIGTSFAYVLGGGLILDKINIGLRYYHGDPEYELSGNYNENTSSLKVKMPATLLELLVGINLDY